MLTSFHSSTNLRAEIQHIATDSRTTRLCRQKNVPNSNLGTRCFERCGRGLFVKERLSTRGQIQLGAMNQMFALRCWEIGRGQQLPKSFNRLSQLPARGQPRAEPLPISESGNSHAESSGGRKFRNHQISGARKFGNCK